MKTKESAVSETNYTSHFITCVDTHISSNSLSVCVCVCVCVCVKVLEVREEWQEERKQLKIAHQRQMSSLKDKHNAVIQKMKQDSTTEASRAAEVYHHMTVT